MKTLTRDAATRIQSAVGDAHHIAILAQWVQSASFIIGQFEHLSTIDQEFSAICKRNSIPVFNAAWEIEHSDALTRLLSIQCQFLNAAHDATTGSAS